MPQLQYDDNYYHYRNSTQVKKANNTRSTMKKGGSNLRSTAVSEDVWRNHRASIRKVLDSDDEMYSSRSTVRKVQAPVSDPKQENKKEVKKVTVTKKNTKSNIKAKKKQKQKPKKMSLKKAEVMGDVSTKAKIKAEKEKHILKNVMYSLCAFSILFLICYRSSMINESFKEVNQMKANLENIKTVNAQIESEIQTQTDLSNIETYAKYQLGMQKPKESQIKKVVIEKSDKISTPIMITEEKENSFWKNLLNDIVHIID